MAKHTRRVRSGAVVLTGWLLMGGTTETAVAAVVFGGAGEAVLQLATVEGAADAGRALLTTRTDTATSATARDDGRVLASGSREGRADADALAKGLRRDRLPVGENALAPRAGDGLLQRVTVTGEARGRSAVDIDADAVADGRLAFFNTSPDTPLTLGFDYRYGLSGELARDAPVDGALSLGLEVASDLEGLIFADRLELGGATPATSGLREQSGQFAFTLEPGATLRLDSALTAAGEAAVVPLPAPAALLATVLAGLALAARRRAGGTSEQRPAEA